MAKIVLLAPDFSPSLAFQEWVLAKGLVRTGHEVTVITSTKEHDPARNAQLLEQHQEIRVIRLKCFVWKGTCIPMWKKQFVGLCQNADAVIINAPSHGFGYTALKVLPRSLKAFVGFGDLRDNRNQINPIVKWVKDRWYRWMFERADKLAVNTNEALGILKEVGLGRHENRVTLAPLPYDESTFAYQPAEKTQPLRTLTTITRVLPHKPFDKWFLPVFEFLRGNPGWRYQLAGLGDDAQSNEIRRMAAESDVADRVELLGMQDQHGMCRLYNAADLGFFPRATIGIQQAMATGLPVVLPRKETVTHLVNEGRNGYYFDALESASSVLGKAAATGWPERGLLAESIRKWSSESYAALILEGLVP